LANVHAIEHTQERLPFEVVHATMSEITGRNQSRNRKMKESKIRSEEVRKFEEAFNADPRSQGFKLKINTNKPGSIEAYSSGVDIEQRTRERRAARRRVGTTSRSMIEWLLRFANGDAPTSATVRRVSADIHEIFARTYGEGALSAIQSAKLGSDAQVEHFGRLHVGLRDDMLNAPRGAWEIESEQLGAFNIGVNGWRPTFRGDEGAVFVFSCQRLLSSPEAQRISRCKAPGCDKWFLRRKRGVYCSPSCGEAAKRSRYFAVPEPERRKRRHSAYKNWVRENRGSAVASKVRPRGRRTQITGKEN
jgi:hypothetical protein